MKGPRNHQRGVALLVALLVVALAVILIAALLDRGELALARTRNALRAEQADAYAQGLEIYAAQILTDPGVRSAGDTNMSPWAIPLPPQPVPGGVISATMRDLNGCFNLNNLAPNAGNPQLWATVFRRLLAVRGVDPGLAQAISNWLDPASNADDNAYLALPVPYRPAHRPFAHVSELRLVRGVSGEVYARLAPYVCVLPPGTTINVNTASVPVLQALGAASPLTPAQAQALWQNGQAHYTGTARDLRALWLRQQISIDPALGVSEIGTSSTYFLARGDIVLDEVPFTFYSLIERGGSRIRVLERSRGSDAALVAPAPIAVNHAGDMLSP